MATGAPPALPEDSHYLFMAANRDREIVYANPRALALLGCASSGTNAPEFNPFKLSGVNKNQRADLESAMLDGQSIECQQSFVPDGKAPLHLQLSISPSYDNARKPTGWTLIGHEVTEHVVLGERYASDAARLQLTLESARMGTWEVDNVTGHAEVDDSWLRLAGIDPSDRERAGEIWKSRIHPEDQQMMLQRIEGAIDGSKDVQSSQYRVIRPDGTQIWVQDTSRVTLRNAEGEPIRLVGVVADITALKQAINSAERSAERLWIATEAAGLGVWDYDLLEDQHFWSKRMREIHGLSEEQESIQAYVALTHPDDKDELEAAAQAGRKSDRPFEVRYRIVRPDGEVRTLETYAIIHRGAEGQAARAVGVTRDITRQVLQEMERHQAQKLESVGRLASGIAHEINTPTQYVSENIRFAKEALDLVAPLAAAMATQDSADEPVEAWRQLTENSRASHLLSEAPQAMTEALDGMDRIAEIIRSMKNFSHPSNQRMPVSLNEAITNTLTITRSEWLPVAEIKRSLDADLPTVPVAIGEFNQVVLNLIVNAAHAIAERQAATPNHPGEIEIITSLNGRYAQLTVVDNGAGMSREVQEKIFDPFFTTKPVGKGTGQGLALVHHFVAAHSGKIQVESKPNSGTRIAIDLPLDTPSRNAHGDGQSLLTGRNRD